MTYYNNKYLVSLDVAKRLNGLQYPESSMYHYIIDKKDDTSKVVTFGSPKQSIKIKNYKSINAPSQSELIKQISNKFKLLVNVSPFKINYYKGEYLNGYKIVYSYEIFDISDPNKTDWVVIDYIGNHEHCFETYEDATDAALFDVLGIVEERYVVWK